MQNQTGVEGLEQPLLLMWDNPIWLEGGELTGLLPGATLCSGLQLEKVWVVCL